MKEPLQNDHKKCAKSAHPYHPQTPKNKPVPPDKRTISSTPNNAHPRPLIATKDKNQSHKPPLPSRNSNKRADEFAKDFSKTGIHFYHRFGIFSAPDIPV